MGPTGKSISVSVRVVRDVRACGRGEAAWAREAAIFCVARAGCENLWRRGGGAAGARPVPGGSGWFRVWFRVPGALRS